jgi:UDP-N-acetylmuramoylalanine--D-glutamate ligase
MDLEGQPVVVVGLARSGVAAARFLASRGARVLATDRKPASELEAEALSLAAIGARLELGGHREATFLDAALVVVSPGVPWDLPELRAARAAHVAVVAEIELAFRHLRGRVVAITGTKGKSTTTAALGAMLSAAGYDTRVGGNIGTPLIGMLEGSSEASVFAVEVSSFQLEGIERFRPSVSVCLNLSPDHLDRHASFDDYARAKGRIFENQTREDWAVVNADDPLAMGLAQKGRARLLSFSGTRVLDGPDAAFFEAGEARLRSGGATETLFSRAAIQLPGAHLASDLLVAAAAARLLGTPLATIAGTAASFNGLEHVLERVAELRGVSFFNDSKATNVDAVAKSLEAFDRPVLAIMGGRYKGGDFSSLSETVARHAKAVLAIGEATDRIAAALSAAAPVTPCRSLGEAVEVAFALAVRGDAVLLAPGCSSFDMFRDYAERGHAFKDAVRRLAAREAPHG